MVATWAIHASVYPSLLNPRRQRTLHQRTEVVHLERFVQHGEGTEPARTLDQGGTVVSGHQQNRGGRGQPAHRGEYAEVVRIGKIDVEKNDVGARGRELVQCRRGVSGL